jgi:hypothetical protein
VVKIVTFSLAVSIVLYVCFYLPRQLKPGGGARLRYLIFSAIAFLFAVMLLKVFR